MKRIAFCFPLVFSIFVSCNSNKSSEEKALVADQKMDESKKLACGPPEKEFGTVDFASACQAANQKDFNLGIALLHSFEYNEAEEVFNSVVEKDPNCALAYWGIAMSNFHQLWPSPATKEELERGTKALEKAKSLVKDEGITRDYINTVAAFYEDPAARSQREGVLKYAKAMEAMYRKYPKDKEVAIFYALSLVSAADPADKTYSSQKKAADLLMSYYKNQPNHPGMVHYLIHAYDSPEMAKLGLNYARSYASIAPSSAHAQHMPSHIFTRLGLWDEVIQSNAASAAAARCYAETMGMEGHYSEELHAIDYMIYGYLQKGDIINAKAQVDYLDRIEKVQPYNFVALYAMSSGPSRYYLENRLWNDAAHFKLRPDVPWDNFPWQKATIHFTRAMGFARMGNIDEAKKEYAAMKPLHDSLLVQKDTYKANQVAIKMKTAEAWISLGEGKKDLAVQQMKEGAEMEDKTEKSPVTPGEVLPAKQLLADMYMEMGRFNEALIAYEEDLKKHPNRFNSIYGAGQASEKLNNTAKAKQYYEQLMLVAAGSTRQEVAYARKNFKK